MFPGGRLKVEAIKGDRVPSVLSELIIFKRYMEALSTVPISKGNGFNTFPNFPSNTSFRLHRTQSESKQTVSNRSWVCKMISRITDWILPITWMQNVDQFRSVPFRLM